MSRIVFGLLAIGAVVIAVALAVAWSGKRHEQAQIEQTAKPSATPAPAPASPPPAPPPSPAPSSAATTPSAPPAPAPAPAPTASVMAPSFDIARIGPDGRAVIAGRAAPDAKIVLLDGGKEIARGAADSRGEWVLLAQDPPLAPGSHELRVVQHLEGRAPVTSEQVVIAVVPAPVPPQPAAAATAPPAASREETLVVIAPPSGGSTVVQPPSSAGLPESGDLQLSTLDYDERGHVTVSGQAAPGSAVRVYIDDKPVGEAQAAADGRWRLAPSEPLTPGRHMLRLDRLAKDGKPTARLEEAFERQAPSNAGSGDSRRLNVVRGDNLWNIARAHYGEGLRYTIIFEANKNQIRDPNLIYPGQTFSLPKVN